MPATNVFRNFENTKIGTTSVTSVRNIVATDQTTQLKDGSDNDQSFTTVINGAVSTQVTVTLRDLVEAEKFFAAGQADFEYDEVAAQGDAQHVKVSNCRFKPPTHNGEWGTLREYTVVGEGGLKVVTEV